MTNTMVTLLGIPFDANSSFLKGPVLAPSRIRLQEAIGAVNTTSETGIAVVKDLDYRDAGDISFTGTVPEAAYLAIRQRVAHELQQPGKLICLGGDRSISFPVIEAHAEKYPTMHVLHIDAHPDLYHNFDDNPFSHASPFARVMERGLVQSLTQVGIRTMNAHQREQARRFNVRVVEMKDFDHSVISELQGPLYISVDLDALDPAFAPGVSHHEPGGFSTRDVIRMIQSIPVEVVGADIVEYNPVRDQHDQTAMVAYKLFKELAVRLMP